MTRIYIPLLAGLLLAVPGCGPSGSGVPKTESRVLPAFNEIDFRGLGRIEVSVGEAQALEITADDNLLALIETRVDNGRLIVQPLDKRLRQKVKLSLSITVTDLKYFCLTGAANVDLSGIDNDNLRIQLAGAGEIDAQGRTKKLDITVIGAGKVRTSELVADNVHVTITGAGDVKVHAGTNLNVNITGSGSVTYAGSPQITQQVVGSGKISRQP
ncbi:MAG: DUF2807 domain-containing protein [Planctomycetes bacterium]|nr:DUF2807 domain-containing protein [Planctomycetota bacterium]